MMKRVEQWHGAKESKFNSGKMHVTVMRGRRKELISGL